MEDEKPSVDTISNITKDIELKGGLSIPDPDEGLSEEEKAKIVRLLFSLPLSFLSFFYLVHACTCKGRNNKLTADRIDDCFGSWTAGSFHG